jgi:transposase
MRPKIGKTLSTDEALRLGRHVIASKMAYRAASEEFGVSAATVCRCVAKARAGKRAGTTPKQRAARERLAAL